MMKQLAQFPNFYFDFRIRRWLGSTLFAIESSAGYSAASLFSGYEEFSAGAGFYIQTL